MIRQITVFTDMISLLPILKYILNKIVNRRTSLIISYDFYHSDLGLNRSVCSTRLTTIVTLITESTLQLWSNVEIDGHLSLQITADK